MTWRFEDLTPAHWHSKWRRIHESLQPKTNHLQLERAKTFTPQKSNIQSEYFLESLCSRRFAWFLLVQL